ncbi:MAG: HAD family hydrolase [Pseudomonadota bacterium]
MKFHNKDAFEGRPDCVLLDLDNTLYAVDAPMAAGQQAARDYARSELSIDPEAFDRAFTVSREELKHRLADTASSHSRLLYFQRTIERVGLATQPFAALQMEQAYWSAFLAEAELFDEVTDFLDDLRIAGVRVVIVTDLTAQVQHRKMLFFGLHRYIDWMVTSEEVKQDKPAPEIFELALAKLGGVEGIIWMIGDNADRDIIGARQAVGALTIQKLHDGVDEGEGDTQPDAIFKHYSDLRRFFSGL